MTDQQWDVLWEMAGTGGFELGGDTVRIRGDIDPRRRKNISDLGERVILIYKSPRHRPDTPLFRWYKDDILSDSDKTMLRDLRNQYLNALNNN